MVRRISSSQFQSKLRNAQSKIRQAQSKHKQTVKKYNQAARTYNNKVRAHNSRVRANRERLRRELAKLERSASKPQYITFRMSVETVQRSYARLEQRAEAAAYDDRYSTFLDLSEQEAANSASVMNALNGNSTEGDTHEDIATTEIDRILSTISQDVRDRWQGALFALNPKNPDAAHHFCTSARELLTEILERHAVDSDVKAVVPRCELTPQGKPTRRSKIRYFLHRKGFDDYTLESFVEDDMDNVIQLFQTFNDGTHGSSGRFGHSQLLAIKNRVEGVVTFLWSIISV